MRGTVTVIGSVFILLTGCMGFAHDGRYVGHALGAGPDCPGANLDVQVSAGVVDGTAVAGRANSDVTGEIDGNGVFSASLTAGSVYARGQIQGGRVIGEWWVKDSSCRGTLNLTKTS